MNPRVWFSIVFALFLSVTAQAQEATSEPTEAEQRVAWTEFLDSIDWNSAGDIGTMGSQAEILVPPGFVFTGSDGTQVLMQAYGNPLTDEELGFIGPERTLEEDGFPWFAVFEFSETGYVKDDDKDELDPVEMLESMREAQVASNTERERMGYDTLDVTGWMMEPNYNEATNNLEWAMRLLASDGSEIVNLNTRLLGREGVMQVTLVCEPEDLDSTIPIYQEMLREFQFQQGHRYAEYRKGDKIAKYGLAGLVVGGGVAALAKTGLLKRFLKPILLGLVALGAFIRKLFGGGGKTADTADTADEEPKAG